MKKVWVLIFISLFVLAGCEGDGITPGVADKDLEAIADPVVVVDAGNLTVSFGPQAGDGSGAMRNRARLVVRILEEVPLMQPVYGDEVCRTDESGGEACSRELLGYGVAGHRVIETFRDVADGALLADGSGSISITIPPGDGYTLEVHTYFRDDSRGPEMHSAVWAPGTKWEYSNFRSS